MWLSLWMDVMIKVQATGGTCFVMAKSKPGYEPDYEREGGAQHGEVKVAMGFLGEARVKYVIYD